LRVWPYSPETVSAVVLAAVDAPPAASSEAESPHAAKTTASDGTAVSVSRRRW
jgi:hypothetical protein